MAKKIWITGDRGANYRRFAVQKPLVEKHFPCFKCIFEQRQWQCTGTIVPSEGCDAYRIRISYRLGGVPKVRILDPSITPSAAIHMYSNGSLCLYYPEEDPWKISDNLHEKIIPWTAEWLVFYELYKICGKWLGPEAPHRTAGEKLAQGTAS